MKKNSKKTNKLNLKKLDKQDKALLVTLALLIVLVVVLAVVAINLKNNVSKEKANIVIPILESKTQNEIGVDLSGMSAGETKEYIFKVSNYKGKDVNKKELTYDILITPSESATIKLYKNDSKKDLVAENDYELEDNKLSKKKKYEDEYHMIIKTTKQPEKKDKIAIKINS